MEAATPSDLNFEERLLYKSCFAAWRTSSYVRILESHKFPVFKRKKRLLQEQILSFRDNNSLEDLARKKKKYYQERDEITVQSSKVLTHIFSFLMDDFKSLGRCTQVCREWRDSVGVASIWKKIAKKHILLPTIMEKYNKGFKYVQEHYRDVRYTNSFWKRLFPGILEESNSSEWMLIKQHLSDAKFQHSKVTEIFELIDIIGGSTGSGYNFVVKIQELISKEAAFTQRATNIALFIVGFTSSPAKYIVVALGWLFLCQELTKGAVPLNLKQDIFEVCELHFGSLNFMEAVEQPIKRAVSAFYVLAKSLPYSSWLENSRIYH